MRTHGSCDTCIYECLVRTFDSSSIHYLSIPGKALIAQNKGGGHGELGYHLALKLIEKDISVTLLQDGAGKNKDKQPFARFVRCAQPFSFTLAHTRPDHSMPAQVGTWQSLHFLPLTLLLLLHAVTLF